MTTLDMLRQERERKKAQQEAPPAGGDTLDALRKARQAKQPDVEEEGPSLLDRLANSYLNVTSRGGDEIKGILEYPGSARRLLFPYEFETGTPDSPFDAKRKELEAQGLPSWQSYRQAAQETTKLPWGVGTLADIVGDPTTYLTFGAGTIAKKLAEAGIKGVVKAGATGAITGAAQGAIGGAAEAQAADQSLLGGAAKGAGAGAALGGALGTGAGLLDAKLKRERLFEPDPNQAIGLGNNVIGLKEIQPGLTKQEQVSNAVRDLAGPVARDADWRVKDNPVVSAANQEKQRGYQATRNVAEAYGQRVEFLAKKNFSPAKDGSIPGLQGIDPRLNGAAPALEDVAARYPVFEPHLSAPQKEALAEIRKMYKDFDDLNVAFRGEHRLRGDVDEGGFYMTRDAAEIADAHPQARVSSGKGVSGKGITSDKAAVFNSKGEGIAAGYRYPSAGEAFRNYAVDVGLKSTDSHIANFYKQFGETAGDRIDVVMKARVAQLRNQIAARRKTLIGQQAREGVTEREMRRAGRRTTAASRRTANAQARAAAKYITPEDVTQSRQDAQEAIRQAQTLSYQLGKQDQLLRDQGQQVTIEDMALSRQVDKLLDELKATQFALASTISTEGPERMAGLRRRTVDVPPEQPLTPDQALRQSQNPPPATADVDLSFAGPALFRAGMAEKAPALLSRIELLTKQLDDLGERAGIAGAVYDRQIQRGEVLKGWTQAAKDDLLAARRAERAASSQSRSFYGAERELRALAREEARLAKAEAGASKRADAAAMRETQTQDDLRGLQGELDAIKGDWAREQERARQTPRGQGAVDLPGLQGYAFPDEISNAAAKIIRDTGTPSGIGSAALRTINAANQLWAAVRATGDDSALWIQGLLGLGGDPKAYGGALKANLRAFVDPTVQGAWLGDFDKKAVTEGRLPAGEWGKRGLHIGGGEYETALPNAVERVPALGKAAQASNRAFGVFGDTLRLLWADDELRNLMRKGRTLDELEASGELKRIADASNQMTGWTRGQTFGSLGQAALFAPRFLQARLETLVKGVYGARGFIDEGFTVPLDQKLAAQSLLRLVAWGTAATFFLNAVQGKETDTRMMVEDATGKTIKNSNFMRVNFGGKKFSVFGTWDSLLTGIVNVGAGRPQDAYRALAGGVPSEAWTLLSGEDAIGRPVRDTPEQLARHIGEAMLPFSALETAESGLRAGQAAIGGDPLEAAAQAVGGAAQIAGVKATDLSLTDVRNAAARRKYGKFYGQLQPAQQDVINADPEVSAMRDNPRERRQGDVLPQGILENRVAEGLAFKEPPYALREDLITLLRHYPNPKLIKNQEVRALAEEYLKARDLLAPYWSGVINETVPVEQQRAYSSWRQLSTRAAQQQFMRENPQARAFPNYDRLVEMRRRRLRLTSPAVDRALQRWYGYARVK